MRGGKDRKIYVTWQDGDLPPVLPDCQMKQIKVISAAHGLRLGDLC